MDKETYKKRQAFAGETKPSMNRRRVGQDYQGRQFYMVTLVVQDRRPLFGEIVGEALPLPQNKTDDPNFEETIHQIKAEIRLSPLGERVRTNFLSIGSRYKEVEVIALQMMPDHLHGILFVREHMQHTLGQIISGFKSGCNKDYRELILGQAPSAPAVSSSSALPSSPTAPSVPSSSAVPSSSVSCVVAMPRQTQPQPHATPSQLSRPRPPRSAYDRERGLLFASGYNDRILFHANQLEVWKNYLADNPRRLYLKRTFSHLLSPHFDVQVAGYTFSAIGNLDLLKAPRRLQVRVSRRCTPTQIQEEVSRYLAAARDGAVLVSPAISPGEKAVMRAAFDASLPVIVLVENGFTPLSKPDGEQFYACTAGRLLMLAPWPHHNEHRTITAAQCQALNLMATAICAKKYN
ncbi:MAG: transposase [Bacteroidaceae bacterium]|nr:transposase [Bacteroidaceae bacterium]